MLFFIVRNKSIIDDFSVYKLLLISCIPIEETYCDKSFMSLNGRQNHMYKSGLRKKDAEIDSQRFIV